MKIAAITGSATRTTTSIEMTNFAFSTNLVIRDLRKRFSLAYGLVVIARRTADVADQQFRLCHSEDIGCDMPGNNSCNHILCNQ